MTVSLKAANDIVTAALEHGAQLEPMPLTVAVLDPGGHIVVLVRQDGSGILRPQIATGKAWGALGMGAGSRALSQLADARPQFMTALAAASGGQVIPTPGGVLIRSADGELLGAVGVSGHTPDGDEKCAVEGIRAAGLVPEPA